jgi:hypothetical protein
MSIRKLSTASAMKGTKSNKFWDQSTYFGDYVQIASAVVDSSGASSITFSSIPGTFTHLQIRAMARGSNASVACDGLVTFNASSTGYYMHQLYGVGAGTPTASYDSTATYTDQFYFTGASASASIFGVGIMDILDYANTNKYKTTRTLGGNDTNGGGLAIMRSGLWQSSLAISSITITAVSGNFVQYSQFSLYGVR